ncbi:MAG: peptidoglycan editing factor PgeF [Gammaproteobacteria bacterium]|nr:peptidoglycan editing factor PgeF [Gammaproteobacteria bacterium]
MQFIKPDWPAPSNVYAYSTTRQHGESDAAFSSFNLADHVGDEPQHVADNRLLLAKHLNLPAEPIWLNQIHSNKVLRLTEAQETKPIGDATITDALDTVCAIMTADCLPILICDRKGTQVSAIHAGWRGLATSIIENTIDEMKEDPSQLLAWLGPAIGPQAFEVSRDVLESFTPLGEPTNEAFKPKPGVSDKWLANIFLLAKQRLQALGLTSIYGGEFCTYSDQKNFYSYRRDHGITGRMATLIWLSA